MKISVEDRLNNIIKYLKNKGYEVYNLSEGVKSDAYIYSESTIGLVNLSNMVEVDSDGALILNSDDKSIQEIEYALSHRVYTPLF